MNMLVRLTEEPERWSRLRESPEDIPAFVEETLLLEAPVVGTFRIVLRPCELGGTALVPGSLVLALLSSANHDAAHPPDTMGVRGAGLTFGHGIHYCLGAPLARMETRISLEELVSRCDRVERRSEELSWTPQLIPRGVTTLPLRFTPA
jgi:cytochrome P450